jgi:hypothetical protein
MAAPRGANIARTEAPRHKAGANDKPWIATHSTVNTQQGLCGWGGLLRLGVCVAGKATTDTHTHRHRHMHTLYRRAASVRAAGTTR